MTMLLRIIFFFTNILLNIIVHGQHLQVSYSAPWGVSLFKYGNHELVNLNKGIGLPMIVESYKTINKSKVAKSEWSTPIGYGWNDKTKEFTMSVSWGTVVCRYHVLADTLFMKVTLTNNSSETFCGVSVSLLSINIGKRPTNFQQYLPYYNNNISAPAVVYANTDQYRLIVESTDPTKNVYVGMLEMNGSNGAVYRLWTGTHPYTGMTDFDERTEIRLAPKQSFTYTVAAKFCAVNTPVAVAAPKVFEAFRRKIPSKIIWKDKRPIGELFLASYTGAQNSLNPRNWTLLTNKYDITSEVGKEELRKSALEYADRSICNLKSMNAQGMITWDIEGQQYPHPFSYIGSPELLAKMAPEMNEIADEYFRKFQKAGFKIGICIRPDSVVFTGNWIEHVAVEDPAATLIRKIAYARKRWGCTLFYIDTNIDPASGQPMLYTYFKRVSEAFTDVLLIPEHERTLYYNYTAPYEEMQSGALLVSEDVKSLYSNSFMVLNVPGGLKGNEQENVKRLSECLKQGNILLFRAWFNDEPANSIIKKAMNMSGLFK